MEKYDLKYDLKIMYVTADSFPEGILPAHEKMHALIDKNDKRSVYGLSKPKEGIISYRVGVEEISEGEAKKLNCETMVLAKGSYLSIVIEDYTKHIEEISKAFQNLLHQPGLDPASYCLELYETPNRVRCMVKIKD